MNGESLGSLPGVARCFSTSQSVTEISGRGVGLDVVQSMAGLILQPDDCAARNVAFRRVGEHEGQASLRHLRYSWWDETVPSSASVAILTDARKMDVAQPVHLWGR